MSFFPIGEFIIYFHYDTNTSHVHINVHFNIYNIAFIPQLTIYLTGYSSWLALEMCLITFPPDPVVLPHLAFMSFVLNIFLISLTKKLRVIPFQNIKLHLAWTISFIFHATA